MRELSILDRSGHAGTLHPMNANTTPRRRRPSAGLPVLALLLAVAASTSQAAGPGEAFRDCPHCPEMTPLPPGSFFMGSDTGKDLYRPQVAVTIATPFAIARTETTFDQWQACVDAGACEGGQSDHAWGKGDRPVINITWDQARAYPAWLGEITGHTYRLPSEAEWEYAARAGTTTTWWFGDTFVEGAVNCRRCDAEPWGGLSSAPVAQFPPNPWGLYDMNGNVWEWTLDCWQPNHAGTPTDGSPRLTVAPAGGPAGSTVTDGACIDKVMKGGAWYYFRQLSQSAARARNDSRVNSYVLGFRVVREMPEGPEERPAQ